MSLVVSSAYEVFCKVFNHNVFFVHELAVSDDFLNLVFKQVFASFVLCFHTVRESLNINLEMSLAFLA